MTFAHVDNFVYLMRMRMDYEGDRPHIGLPEHIFNFNSPRTVGRLATAQAAIPYNLTLSYLFKMYVNKQEAINQDNILYRN